MRVLAVHHESCLGGAELSLLELVACLAKAGVSFEVLLPSRGPLQKRFAQLHIPVHFVDMPSGRIRAHPGRFALEAIRASIQVACSVPLRRFDLVHANSVISHLCVSPAARLLRVPSILHVRDFVDSRFVARTAGCMAELIVAPSRAVAENLMRAGVPSRKIRVVMNGVDLSEIREATGGSNRTKTRIRAAARKTLGLPSNAFVAMSAGTFVPRKRHELFLQAFAGLLERQVSPRDRPPVRAVLIGGDQRGLEPDYEKRLTATAASLPPGKLLLTGWRDDFRKLLPAADVFVSLSAREPFGRVLVEAMAQGVPVIACDSGAAGEIVEPARTGFIVRDGDVAAATEKLAWFKEHPAERRGMGRAARKAALQRFDVRRTAAEIKRLYLEIAAPRA